MRWTRRSAFFLPRGLRFAKGPAINLHVDSHANFYALSFKQLSLQCGVWLRHANPAASPEHAMPRNPLAPRAGCQGVTDSARSSPRPHRFRYLAIGGYAPARDFFHLTIDRIPGHFAPCYARCATRKVRCVQIGWQRFVSCAIATRINSSPQAAPSSVLRRQMLRLQTNN
jgi:hypothetical protein